MSDWRERARREIDAVLNRLPADIRSKAEEVPVFLENGGAGNDLLGLFEGCSLLDGPPENARDMPRITLFVDNLLDEAEGDRAAFLEEVRLTFFHELGHYLGWDEEEVARRGLA